MSNQIADFEWLIGDRIESVRFEIESGAWIVNFQCRASLRIESMWRLIEDGTICSTGLDHGHWFGRTHEFDGVAALQEMGQYRIESVRVRPETGDLFIMLGKMFELEVISTSAGYEPWQMTHPSLGTVVASGGELHIFGP